MNNIIQKDKKLFKNTLVTKVSLKNGKTTEILVVFNNSEIGHEEINIGIRTALEHSHNAKSMQSSLYSFTNGELEEECTIEESLIKEYNPELDPELNDHLKY